MRLRWEHAKRALERQATLENDDLGRRVQHQRRGALYLLAILVGFVTLRYLPDVLIQSGDALGTAHKLVEHQFLLRRAIVGDFVAGVVWLSVVLALYRLLKGVDRTQANLWSFSAPSCKCRFTSLTS